MPQQNSRHIMPQIDVSFLECSYVCSHDQELLWSHLGPVCQYVRVNSL